MKPLDLIERIEQIMIERFRYYKHYYGQVLDNKDPEKLGRVLVSVEQLGWLNAESGAWCFPRGNFEVPNIKDWVDIYFMAGRSDTPVYIGIAREQFEMLQKDFDGEPTTKVLFEDKKTDTSIVFDGLIPELKIGSGVESFVLGDTLKTELQKNVDALTQLQTDFTSWTPVPTDGGLALKTLLGAGFLTKTIASLNNILSILIKGE